ncbi:MAG: hypothetical protein PHY44_03540 [Lachnospiraceae bacterium]|nr:hypothetical protein [Lachnospiraceae bacterium]
MNICICEEDILERKRLIRHIGGYYYGRHIPIRITEFASVDLLVKSLVFTVADIVMVSLKAESEIGDLSNIRKLCSSSALIIVSDTERYGIEAYHLQATDYLLKPVCYSQLCKALTRCELLV